MKFTELALSSEVLDGIDAMNFVDMTPVQEQTIPIILESKDLIACAQTGTGKTAAFLLPLLSMLREHQSSGSKVRALIIVPTRELALQIDQQVEGFAYFCPTTSISVYGGGSSGLWDQQRKAITEGADIIVATPGRLLAHIQLGYVDFSGLEYLVLDEADRMLDMGFYEDILSIVKALPEQRQSLMFSATMPPKIRTLARTLLQNPQEINIAVSRPNEAIDQAVYMTYDEQKIPLLCKIISEENMQSVVVFSSTKVNAKNITRTLLKNKVKAQDIHSDLDQQQREAGIRDFKARNIQVLVATDIISRGIDIEDIDMVVNFDVPNEPEDYVHRIGRTARAHAKGKALTFVNERDQGNYKRIEDFLGRELPRLVLPSDLGESPEYNPEKNRSFRPGQGARNPQRKTRSQVSKHSSKSRNPQAFRAADTKQVESKQRVKLVVKKKGDQK